MAEGAETGDNQPRYTTKRLHDEIAKAKAYGIEQAAALVDEMVDDDCFPLSERHRISKAIRALRTPAEREDTALSPASKRPADCTPATNHKCPNMKEVGGGFDGERYRCDVCGEGYYLDYEDMK